MSSPRTIAETAAEPTAAEGTATEAPSEFVSLPPGVDAMLAVALAKTPDDRFASAGELAVALEEALAGRPNPDIVARARQLARQMPWGAGSP